MRTTSLLISLAALTAATACATGSSAIEGEEVPFNDEPIPAADQEQEQAQQERGELDRSNLFRTPQMGYIHAQAQMNADLDALADLEIFEVSEMVITSDMMPGICYGPCSDDDERKQRFIDQAQRLHDLVELADDDLDTLGSGPEDAGEPEIIEDSLDAIDALDILVVGDFLEEEAESSPYCYNLPCPEEIERVEALNEARAQSLWHLADRSADL